MQLEHLVADRNLEAEFLEGLTRRRNFGRLSPLDTAARCYPVVQRVTVSFDERDVVAESDQDGRPIGIAR